MKRTTRCRSDGNKAELNFAFAVIVLAFVVCFCIFVLITGLKVNQKADEVSAAVAEVLTPTPEPTPEPTPIVVVEKQTVVHTEYVPVLEYIEVPVEVPVEVVTYVQVPVNSACTNRYATIKLSAHDLELLARIAWREARGEGILGMRLVIEVVLNRVLSSQFPNTVYDVLYDGNQFKPYDGALELDEITPTQAQYDAVSLVLTETPITDADVYFFATRALTDALFMHVGGHYFCKNGNWY